MKMILKNTKIKQKKKLKLNIGKYITKRHLFLFLIYFLIISIILGIIFYIYLNSNDKNMINNNIISYFTIKEKYNYQELLKTSILNNIKNILIIWTLGISIIGIVIILFILFIEGFSMGFTISGIFNTYKLKGLLGNICYLFPYKIIYIIILFLICFLSLSFSFNLIKTISYKNYHIDIKKAFTKYLKTLIIFILLSIICSLFEVFINPYMIKIFTLIEK